MLIRNDMKHDTQEPSNTHSKVMPMESAAKIKPIVDGESVDYREFKDQEFKRFFTNGLSLKPIDSKTVIFINFFLFFRLGVFDLCYLTLTHLPQVQIGLLIFIESIFMFMIL